MLYSLLRQLFQGQLSRDTLIQVLLSVPVILFSLSFHEFSHALVANLLGDKTARNLGRMTLNPIKHLHPVGTVMMLLFGFGWAKPVPISTRNFKKPKWGMALTALAGPVSNLLLAFVSFNIYYLLQTRIYFYNQGNQFVWVISLFFLIMTSLNISLAIFNLIPVPPLDGSRILFVFLPAKLYFAVMKYEQYLHLALILLVAMGGLTNFIGMVNTWIINLFLSFATLVFG